MQCSLYLWIIALLISVTDSARPLSKDDRISLREATREMLNHAFNGYMQYAYPKDELMPMTCQGKNTWGNFRLTLIDSLDTLLLTGDLRGFRKVEEIVKKMNFDFDKNVSVFETNIRIVGGLISAHLLYKKAKMPLPNGWPCKGPMLELALDVADRLLPGTLFFIKKRNFTPISFQHNDRDAFWFHKSQLRSYQR